jgi:hypothetical protein
MNETKGPARHIVPTSHPRDGERRLPIAWGAADPRLRGPVIGSLTDPGQRNVIGVHSGSHALYRALAIAAGSLSPLHKPDLTDTAPPVELGPHPQWSDPEKIVALDPFGHLAGEAFKDLIADGIDIRPTIAVAKARLTVPEFKEEMRAGRLEPDGKIVLESGEINCTKVAIEPVWYLPGVAQRCGIGEQDLRRSLFEHTGGMFPELVTPAGPACLPAAHRRRYRLYLRRGLHARRSEPQAGLPGPRRVQWLGRLRLRHLQLPALPGSRHRHLRACRPGGWGRADRL